MTHLRFKAAIALGALVIVSGAMLLAAACSSSKDADATPSVAATGQASTPASLAPAVISAINLLDNAGLHDFNTQIDAGTVPPTAQTVVTKLVAVMKLTPWPDALKTQADNMTTAFETYVTQLNTDTPDMSALDTAATNAHEGEHDFSHDVWNWLYAQAGVNTSAPSSGASASSTSTAASH